MKFRNLVLALLLGAALPVTALAQEGGEEFTQEDAKDMAFSKLSEDKQKAVIAMLKKLMDESIGEAEKSIKEDGAMVPFGYVANAQGEGQFLRLDDKQDIRAEVAAHAIQKAIVTNAFRGNLVASALYLTMGKPEGMSDVEEELEESIGDDREIEDVRFLMVELQHLGGIGLVSTIPYWKQDGEWVFGEAVQKQVEPELHTVVRETFRNAAEKQQGQAQQQDGS